MHNHVGKKEEEEGLPISKRALNTCVWILSQRAKEVRCKHSRQRAARLDGAIRCEGPRIFSTFDIHRWEHELHVPC